MSYSYSKLQTYKQCPKKYKFQYIDRIDTGRETIESFMGSRVHEALEKLYRDLRLTKVNTLDEILNWYESQWVKNWHSNVFVIRSGVEPSHYQTLGRQCITDYYNAYFPFNQARTLALEDRIEVKLKTEDTSYVLIGFIDRLAYALDGTYEIHDYKTSGYLPTQEDLEKDGQLTLYQIGLSQRWLDATRVKLIWHYLAFNKELSIVREETDLEELGKATIETIKQVESDSDLVPRKSSLCDWCEYRTICPLWKHTIAVETLPPDSFQKDAGVNLVKRYVELEAKKAEIEKELEALKSEAIAYAGQQDIYVIDGGDFQLKVETKEELKIPTKREDPVNWEKLRKTIIDAGKWQDVSYLSWQAIARVLKYRIWSDNLTAMVKQFVTKKHSKEVRLVKKLTRLF